MPDPYSTRDGAGPAVRRGPSTTAVHAGSGAAEVGGAVAGEIFQTTTFVSDPLGEGEVLYSRFGNNPNHRRLEAKIAALEGAEACLVTNSGMAAMAAALLACAEAGDHVLAASALYGGTRSFLDRELSRLGIHTTYVDFFSEGWEAAIRPETRVILAELTTNPTMRVPDPAPLADAARRIGAELIIDVTFATPVNFRGLEHGVGMVVHSATKYLGGHSDVTAGAVCGSAALIDRARERSQLFGTAPDPHATWLVERGMKTLALRMQRHNLNGLEVASWLEAQPEVRRVHYPGLPSHPDHERAKRLLNGFGGMVGVELVGDPARATDFATALELCRLAPSLGGVETLASEPRFTSHGKLTSAERAELGFPDGFIRFSLGIEDSADLIADMRQALDSLAGSEATGSTSASSGNNSRTVSSAGGPVADPAPTALAPGSGD